MNIKQYIIFFVVSILLSYIYKNIKRRNTRTSDYYYMVNQYLLTNNSDFPHLEVIINHIYDTFT